MKTNTKNNLQNKQEKKKKLLKHFIPPKKRCFIKPPKRTHFKPLFNLFNNKLNTFLFNSDVMLALEIFSFEKKHQQKQTPVAQ